jgi:ABC-type cobalamin/Fe3+-siderophores transport system ATPase subunit
MTDKENLLKTIEISLKQLSIHKQIAIECEVEENTLELHDKVIDHFITLQGIVKKIELSINYINQFQDDINKTIQDFPFIRQPDTQFLYKDHKPFHKETIEDFSVQIERQLTLLKFNLDFFQKLDFCNQNIVAVGANGSGKTTLSNYLKKYLPEKGVIISAQRILIIPTFSSISNINDTSQKLAKYQAVDKSLRATYSTLHQNNAFRLFASLGNEFQFLLENLLAERNAVVNKFYISCKDGQRDTPIPTTKLDKTLSIWNSLMEHKIIECTDGINITLRFEGLEAYPAFQMSDGEKVMLYLIAQVLQAPDSGFIVIDEPEMYLHKTIVNKLWDVLEKERPDCIFVYLTHDLDFAARRITAKKVWIRSFTYPDKWIIESIPENDLPEALLLELLGSRKNILFCEGEKGKIDEQIYNILFPDFTVTPVGTCFEVINYTKAFNKLPNLTTKAVGIIDSDHHGIERLEALKSDNIFSFSMVEPENLLLDEDFLKLLIKQICIDDDPSKSVEKIKLLVISQFETDILLQVSNYVSSKINYYFKTSHVSKGNTLVEVNDNYSNFKNEIKIQEWYEKRKVELEEIIEEKDYSKALSVYNNKGLKRIANKQLKIANFTEKAIKFLKKEPSTHEILLKYFPEELKNGNG